MQKRYNFFNDLRISKGKDTMNASAFRDLSARVNVFKVPKNCISRSGTFKMTRMTINHKMNEQVHAVFYLIK